MKQFVRKVKEDFDYVLFDTPPLGIISDALILSKVIDAVVLVIESGKTPRKALVRNQKILMETGIRCAGIILVKAPSTGSESYYYSSKYYTKD
jgi:Mrp family chromosome partitioning ATPase